MALRNTTVPLEIVQQLEAERIQRRAQRQAMAQQIEMQRLQQMAEPVRWAQPEPERVNAAAEPFNRKASAEAGLQNMRDGSAMQRQRESQAHDSAMMDKKGALEKDLLAFRAKLSSRGKSGAYRDLAHKYVEFRQKQAQQVPGSTEYQALDAAAAREFLRLPKQYKAELQAVQFDPDGFAARLSGREAGVQHKAQWELEQRQAGLKPPQEGMTPATAVQAMKIVGDPVTGMGLGKDREVLRQQAMGVIQGQQPQGGPRIVRKGVDAQGRRIGQTDTGEIVPL